MKRTGIGGMQMFDGDIGVATLCGSSIDLDDTEWKAALHHAASDANRLHLDMGMAASGGWSESGGPWVKPEQGMKKYVWSEIKIRGPRQFNEKLPHPPEMYSKFQNLTPAHDFKLQGATDLQVLNSSLRGDPIRYSRFFMRMQRWWPTNSPMRR